VFFRYWDRMHRFARLQLIGPVVLFCAVLAAESAAYALAEMPSSAFLWYLNLDVFGLFRKSRILMGDWGAIPFGQLMIAAPLAALAAAGLLWRRNLVAAAASNLSFVYAVFLVYSWQFWNGAAQARAASLTLVQVPAGYDLWLFAVLLLASFLSFAVSHLLYLRAVQGRA
jgi:hypothetical protein